MVTSGGDVCSCFLWLVFDGMAPQCDCTREGEPVSRLQVPAKVGSSAGGTRTLRCWQWAVLAWNRTSLHTVTNPVKELEQEKSQLVII